MNRRTLTLVAAGAALALPAAAQGKGASQATVTGPGLTSPLVLKGPERPGSKTMILAESSGFFPGVFGQSPDPMLARPPSGSLGPRYSIAYLLPGPDGTHDTIRQDVYPYARPWPVTYMPRGQRFFGRGRTRGGWFEGDPRLKQLLVAAGLPASAEAATKASSSPWGARVGMSLAAAAGLALGGAALVRRRRRR
jgi:hypothetical protein